MLNPRSYSLTNPSQLQTTAPTTQCPNPGSTTYPIFPVTDSSTTTNLSLVDLSIVEPAHAVVPGYDPDKPPPNETCVEPRHRTPQLTAEKNPQRMRNTSLNDVQSGNSVAESHRVADSSSPRP
jgi:hypothetical protein